MRNLLSEEYSSSNFHLAGQPLNQVVPRLDALMMVLKSCKGRTCVEPWRELHPSGDVTSIIDSLKPEFDEFYLAQPKVSFTECKRGYLPEFEGPMDVTRYDAWSQDTAEGGWRQGELKRDTNGYGGRWSDWT